MGTTVQIKGRAHLLPGFLFLFSGFASLIFETLCSRRLALVIGSTVQSASVTVAAFLFSLGLGAHLGGWLTRRRIRPVITFAALEACAGLSALVVLAAIPRLPGLLVPLAHSAPGLLGVTKVLLIFLLLLVPGCAMGASLPILAHFYVERMGRGFVASLGLLYGINTLGAACGVLATDWYLVKALGVTRSGWVSCGLYLTVALVALAFTRLEPRIEEPVAAESPPEKVGSYPEATLVLAVSGFCGLTFQVLWTRMLTFFHGNDVFSFSIALSVYLLGLVVGSLLLARFGQGLVKSRTVLGWLLCLLGFLAYLSLLTVGLVRQLSAALLAAGMHPFLKNFLAGGLVMLPATICLGLCFPIAAEQLRRAGKSAGRAVGNAYILNTLGSVLGALSAGYLLLPNLGLQTSLALQSALTVVVGGAICWRHSSRKPLAVIVPLLFAGLLLATPSDSLGRTLYGDRYPYIVFSANDHYGSLALTKEWNPVLQEYEEELRVDGFNMAGNSVLARRYTVGLAALPMLLTKEPREVLIVCMGLGNTLNTALSLKESEQVQCVELSPKIPEALRHTEHGPRILANPKLSVEFGDGRNHLQNTQRGYDVISAEPPPPTHAGVVNLYSREYYELCSKRLNKHGVVAQWLPVFQMSVFETQTMIKAFVEVFPNSYLWQTSAHQLCLIGGNEPLSLDFSQLVESSERNQEFLAQSGWDNPALTAGLALAGPQALQEYTRDIPALTDDWPIIQYSDGRFAVDRKFFFLSGHGKEVKWVAEPEQQEQIDRARRAALAAYLYYDRFPGYVKLGSLERLDMGRFALETFPGDLYYQTRLQAAPLHLSQTEERLELEPQNPLHHYELARISFLNGDYARAHEAVESGLKVAGEQRELFRTLGLLIQFRQGKREEVLSALEFESLPPGPNTDYLQSLLREK